MGRRLPWKTSTTPTSADKSRAVKAESPRVTAARSPCVRSTPSTVASLSEKPRRERVVDSKDNVRSPSTSPPPEPPVERFMVPGPAHDDRYRIVEDEFLNVAHQFTTHLHRAEYNRLKTLAKSQNAATIREIERPVFGAPTLLSRQRQESVRRFAKQRKALGGGGSPGDDMPFMGSSLQGLLESPRKEAKWISNGAAGSITTRAAAGYGSHMSGSPARRERHRASEDHHSSGQKRRRAAHDNIEESGGDDDLATPSWRLTTKVPRTPSVPSPVASRSASRPMSSEVRTPSTTITAARLKVTTPGSAMSTLTSRAMALEMTGDGPDDDDDPFGINRRRTQRLHSREQTRKVEQRAPTRSSALDDIPSFI